MFPFSNTSCFTLTFAEYFDIGMVWWCGRTKNGSKFTASLNKYLLHATPWHDLCLGKWKWTRQAWLQPSGILQSPETVNAISITQRERHESLLGDHRWGQGVSVDFSEEQGWNEYKTWKMDMSNATCGMGLEAHSRQSSGTSHMDLQFVQGTEVPTEAMRGIQPYSALH